jgi:heterokaryon incompatibility protein (HET)
MWLLNTKSYQLRAFTSKLPEYAILSHTWEEEEISFQDVQTRNLSHKKGYAKLVGSCTLAHQHGYEWIWIDTCCIDKTSSSELSEAINSMFRLYKESNVCYVYLSDLRHNSLNKLEDFETCRWWSRGWTLQELIAPSYVEFHNLDWKEVGTKSSLEVKISKITNIDQSVLRGKPISSCNVGERMSWAAKRKTSRPEDRAYSLLGLFDVHIPLLYGEGEHNAFRRLQEEILKWTDDHTLFIHQGDPHSLLAPSPSAFLTPFSVRKHSPTELSSRPGKTTDANEELVIRSYNVFDLFHRPWQEMATSITPRGIKLSLVCKRDTHNSIVRKALLKLRKREAHRSNVRKAFLSVCITNGLEVSLVGIFLVQLSLTDYYFANRSAYYLEPKDDSDPVQSINIIYRLGIQRLDDPLPFPVLHPVFDVSKWQHCQNFGERLGVCALGLVAPCSGNSQDSRISVVVWYGYWMGKRPFCKLTNRVEDAELWFQQVSIKEKPEFLHEYAGDRDELVLSCGQRIIAAVRRRPCSGLAGTQPAEYQVFIDLE